MGNNCSQPGAGCCGSEPGQSGGSRPTRRKKHRKSKSNSSSLLASPIPFDSNEALSSRRGQTESFDDGLPVVERFIDSQ